MTASFGVDSYRLGEVISTEALVKRTDEYLLRAKEMGRDRVSCNEELLSELRETEVTEKEREVLLKRPGAGDGKRDS
jgi:hypothetical protein